MENFTPITGLIGGLFIGSAAILTLWASGRIAGISGILSGLLFPHKTDTAWRALFTGGILVGAACFAWFNGGLTIDIQTSPGLTIIAGLLVGFGTRLGSGCTSGHGICGIGRLSQRSFTATATFILVAIVTVYLTRHVAGGIM